MAVVRTTKCSGRGHPEFCITFDSDRVPIEADVRLFINWLEDSVAEGTRYVPDQTCQVGWVTTQVRQNENGDLTLWEPDMRHMPVIWIEGVSNTLALLRLQKDVVESVLESEALSFSSMRESGLVCTRLESGRDVVMERAEPSGADSGWFCGCREETHNHNDASELRPVSLYEAALSAPQILPYLALPPGVLLVTEVGVPTLFLNGNTLNIRPGSYLDARFSGLKPQ